VTGSRSVAAFDFDGTLTRGGSVWRFLSTVVGTRRVLQAALVLAPRLAYAALVGGRAADDAKEALFVRTLGGLRAAEVAERSMEFGRLHYRRRARSDVRRQMEWHRNQGHRLIIVSASPRSYVSAVGELLDTDAVLATDLAVDGAGRLTGRYEGRNCRAQEKLDRVRAQMAAWEADDRSTAAHDDDHKGPTPGPLPEVALWAYGNSRGDLRLLEGATVGVDVGRLGPIGSLRRFRRLESANVPRPSS
jgi:phosphatidylglycerophosphatase C